MWGKLRRELRIGLVMCLLAAIVILVFSPFVDLPPTLNKKGRFFVAVIRRFARLLISNDAVGGLLSPLALRAVPVPHANPARVMLC